MSEDRREAPPVPSAPVELDDEPGALLRGLDHVGEFLHTPDGIPFTLILLVTSLWIGKLSQLVIFRQNRYGSFDFDSGIFDQAGWLAAHGSQFDTVRGIPLFGHHATFGFYLFAPFYRLGFDGPTVMNVAQVIALGVVPLIAYWVARRVGLEPWIACVVGFVCAAHFSTAWLAQELFHPEVFAIAPLLAAYGFALRDQNKAYWATLAFAIIWKEDVALTIVGLGIVFVLQHRRRLGVQTLLFGMVWFLIATQLLLPHFSPTGKAFYAEGFYGNLGTNFTGIATSFVRHPNFVVAHLRRAHTAGYLRDLWAPFGFVNLLSPATLFIAFPQLLANLLSINSFTWSLRYHYVALPLMASMLGFVLGLARLRGSWRAFAAGVALTASIATALSWSVAPYGKHYEQGYWPLSSSADQAELDHAVSLIPDGASVSASYHLVPHLSSRELIFSFPNPWKARNWGIHDANTRSPASVEWLIVQLADLDTDHQQLLNQILSDTNDIQVVYRTSAVVVARRTRPG